MASRNNEEKQIFTFGLTRFETVFTSDSGDHWWTFLGQMLKQLTLTYANFNFYRCYGLARSGCV
jgi:hypothetical protein